MARKKPVQKKGPAQPTQDVSDKLLEDLLGELARAVPDGEADVEALEATAPELLEVLSAAVEAEPAAPAMAAGEAAEETTHALAAMQTAMEQDPEPVVPATLSAPPETAQREEAETPECLPATPPLALVAEQEAREESPEQRVAPAAAEGLAPAADYSLLPFEEIEPTRLEETEPVAAAEPEPAATPSLSRRALVSSGEGEAPGEGQPDILTRLVAGIDTRVATTPVWERRDTEEAEEEDAVEAYASFHLSGTAFAVPVGAIREIDRVTEITPVPNVPAFIRGVINLRGDVTCVLDMRSFIGLAPLEDHESGWLVVVCGTETRRSLALLVDEMSSLVRIPARKVKPPAGKVEDRVIPLLQGVVEQRDRVLGVLSVDSLLGSPDVRELWM
jgi:purine-binding chemotaxis protein CheW